MGILKSITLLIVFCLATLLFLPKHNLYYAAEKELKKYDVIISDEKFSSQLFGFKLENASLFVKEVNIASLDNVNIFLSGVDISSKTIGYADAKLDIMNQSIVVNFEPTKMFIRKYQTVLKYFKKQQDGVYKYEYKLF
ncbi:MAG: hypothetical protein KAQ94_08830 [Arcobacteraceae bacterium]|nr:hypothetical protein [Arcobacteraceae bacterium]